MSKVLFNIDDLSLILVISSSLIFILILLSDKRHLQHKRWLSLFLACVAISCFDTLIYWSGPVKQELIFLQPHAFFLLKAVQFLSAPVLFTYARSLIYKDFKLQRHDLLHFSPAIAYVCAIPVIYSTMGREQLEAGIIHFNLYFDNPIYWTCTWMMHFVQLGYGLATYRLLQRHKERLEDVSSNIEGVHGKWLKMLVVGFVFLWLLRTISPAFSVLAIGSLAQFVGVLSNYFLFILVNSLVVFSLSRSTVTTSQKEANTPEAVQPHDYTEEQIHRLDRTMKERQPFLNPDLTLEDLSRISSIPQRTLSSIINRHHHKNFFEFVNEYRVNMAAELLLNEENKLSMLDIMNEAGFNSKSAFNRFFKKITGMTPTQYRNTQSAQASQTPPLAENK